jgi:phosphate transport system protein
MSKSSDQSDRVLRVSHDTQLDTELGSLRRRIIREASQAIEILKSSIDALWDLDVSAAPAISAVENEIDVEEVAIEQECYKILALKNPFAADFRLIAFCLKVNSDIERVADHASSITKITAKLDSPIRDWPPALLEMGERIPVMCEQVLRAVVNTDTDLARSVSLSDKAIDKLDRQAFHEISSMIERDPKGASTYLLMYRIARELERVGDLLGNIAEEIVYLQSGEIIRHKQKGTPPTPSSPTRSAS